MSVAFLVVLLSCFLLHLCLHSFLFNDCDCDHSEAGAGHHTLLLLLDNPLRVDSHRVHHHILHVTALVPAEEAQPLHHHVDQHTEKQEAEPFLHTLRPLDHRSHQSQCLLHHLPRGLHLLEPNKVLAVKVRGDNLDLSLLVHLLGGHGHGRGHGHGGRHVGSLVGVAWAGGGLHDGGHSVGRGRGPLLCLYPSRHNNREGEGNANVVSHARGCKDHTQRGEGEEGEAEEEEVGTHRSLVGGDCENDHGHKLKEEEEVKEGNDHGNGSDGRGSHAGLGHAGRGRGRGRGLDLDLDLQYSSHHHGCHGEGCGCRSHLVHRHYHRRRHEEDPFIIVENSILCVCVCQWIDTF